MPTIDRYLPDAPAQCDVAIVGGGFAGLMTLARMVELAPKCQFAVFERRPRPGPGVAYGACDPQHLLNVPAGRMGAYPEDPAGFHAWLERVHPGRFRPDEFVPRALFGRYLVETVRAAIEASGACVQFVQDAAVHAEPLGQAFEMLLASGRTVLARGVVLAPGLPQARAPWRGVDEGVARHLVAHDPWDSAALDGLAPTDEVVVVGSGLTAIDVVTALRRRGHAGRIVVVSRGGRWPLPHAAAHGTPVAYAASELAGGASQAFHTIRAAAKALMRDGHGWHAAIDGVRPHAAATWRAWSDAERRRFLRWLRPYWEIHRHRAPAHVLSAIEAECAAGSIELVAGALASLRNGSDGSAEVMVRTQHGSLRSFHAARVINCAGPAMSVGETLDPLLGSMLRHGMASVDALGLGVRTDSEGRLVGADGSAQSRLRLIGALRRGDLWESTAVPELRGQAAQVAASLARELGCGDARMLGSGLGLALDAAPRGSIEGCA